MTRTEEGRNPIAERYLREHPVSPCQSSSMWTRMQRHQEHQQLLAEKVADANTPRARNEHADRSGQGCRRDGTQEPGDCSRTRGPDVAKSAARAPAWRSRYR